MKNKLLNVAVLSLACAFALPRAAPAEPPPPADEQAVAAAIAAFNTALRAGDFEALAGLLDPKVLVLESGGAERSREEYLASHAKADAAFLQKAQVLPGASAVTVVGDLAYATATSLMRYERNGKPAAADSAETMILRRGPGGWKIVHIHWSSHPRSAP